MASVAAPESESPIATQAREMFGMHVWSTMEELNELDYDSWTRWKLKLEVILGMMDLDLALRQDKPSTPTETSSPEEKSKYEKWERSNRLSLLLMRSKMPSHLHFLMPETENFKEYLAGIENLVMKFEKDGAHLLLDKLLKMKYDGEGNVRDHIFKMCSIANRLKAVGTKLDDNRFLLWIIDSLPWQFNDFKVLASAKDWKLDDFISVCARYETTIREDDMAGPMLGKRGRIGNINYNGYDENVGDFDGNQGKIVQNRRVIRCFSCGREGHRQKDCMN